MPPLGRTRLVWAAALLLALLTSAHQPSTVSSEAVCSGGLDRSALAVSDPLALPVFTGYPVSNLVNLASSDGWSPAPGFNDGDVFYSTFNLHPSNTSDTYVAAAVLLPVATNQQPTHVYLVPGASSNLSHAVQVWDVQSSPVNADGWLRLDFASPYTQHQVTLAYAQYGAASGGAVSVGSVAFSTYSEWWASNVSDPLDLRYRSHYSINNLLDGQHGPWVPLPQTPTTTNGSATTAGNVTVSTAQVNTTYYYAQFTFAQKLSIAAVRLQLRTLDDGSRPTAVVVSQGHVSNVNNTLTSWTLSTDDVCGDGSIVLPLVQLHNTTKLTLTFINTVAPYGLALNGVSFLAIQPTITVATSSMQSSAAQSTYSTLAITSPGSSFTVTPVVTHHWSFSALSSDGDFPDVVGGWAAELSVLDSTSYQPRWAVVYGAPFINTGAFINVPYEQTPCTMCTPVDQVLLRVSLPSSVATLNVTAGWGVTFWYLPDSNLLAALSTAATPQVIYTDQQDDGTWTYQVQMQISQPWSGSTDWSLQLVTYQQCQGCSSPATAQVQMRIARSSAVGWTFFSISALPDRSKNTLTVSLAINVTQATTTTSFTLTSMVLPALQASSWSLAGCANTTVYGSLSSVSSSLYGALAEVWLFNGAPTSDMLHNLYTTNSPVSVQTVYGQGYTMVYNIDSNNAVVAYNDSAMVQQPTIVSTGNTTTYEGESGTVVTADETNPLGSRAHHVLGTVTLHSLPYSFERNTQMLALSPAEVSLSCSDQSVDHSQASTVATLCQNFASVLPTLAPVYITQDVATGVLSNVYLQSNYPSEDTLYQGVALLLSLLDWNNAELPSPLANDTMLGQQPGVTVSSSSASVSSAIATPVSAMATTPSTYHTKAVHPHLFRPIRRTHKLHYSAAAAVQAHRATRPALANQLAQALAASVSPASFCMEVRSEIDHNPDEQQVTPLDYYNTTVLTCYQSGVGPVASAMVEQGVLDNSPPLVHIETASIDGHGGGGGSGGGRNNSGGTNSSGTTIKHTVAQMQSTQTLHTYVVDSTGSTFFLHINITQLAADTADVVEPTPVSITFANGSVYTYTAEEMQSLITSSQQPASALSQHAVVFNESSLSLLSSSSMQPYISSGSGVELFELDDSSTSHCMWLLDTWGGVKQACRDLPAIDISSSFADWQWTTIVDPSTDFQAISIDVRPHVSPCATLFTSADWSASAISAVAIDTFGIVHAAQLVSPSDGSDGRWVWQVVHMDDNNINWHQLRIHSDPSGYVSNDTLDHEDDAYMLGVAYSGDRLFRVYVRPSWNISAALLTRGYTESVFNLTARVSPLITHSNGGLDDHSVYEWAVANTNANTDPQSSETAPSADSPLYYALSGTMQLRYSAFNTSAGVYDKWHALLPNITNFNTYTVQRSANEVTQGVLAIDRNGQLQCAESTATASFNSSHRHFTATPLAGLVQCRPHKAGAAKCSRNELAHFERDQAKLIRPITTTHSYIDHTTTPTLSWLLTNQYAVLMYRPDTAHTGSCGWQNLMQLHLSSLKTIKARHSNRTSNGQTATYSFGSTSDSVQTSSAYTAQTSSASSSGGAILSGPHVPYQFSDTADAQEVSEEAYEDEFNDGGQAAYNSNVQLRVSLSSLTSTGTQVEQRFTVGPYTSNSSQLVPSPYSGVTGVFSNLVAVPFVTLNTYMPDPTATNLTSVVDILTKLTADTMNLNEDAYNAYKLTLNGEGDVAVQLVNQAIFQHQSAALSSRVLNNANLTGWVLGAIASQFPPSTLISSIINGLLTSTSPTYSTGVQSAAMQAAAFIHCPSAALSSTAAQLSQNMALEASGADGSALVWAAASAVSIWASNLDCSQSAAQSMGQSHVQVQQTMAAATFWQPRATSTKLQQLTAVTCPTSLQQTNATDGSDNSTDPACAASNLRQSVNNLLATASSPTHASRVMTLLGNTGHSDDVDTLLQHAYDQQQSTQVRYHALLALRRVSPLNDSIVNALFYIQGTDPSETVRLGALRSLAAMASKPGNDCHNPTMWRATRMMSWQLFRTTRHAVELRPISDFLLARQLCGSADHALAVVTQQRVQHLIQSAFVQNGPYTTLSLVSIINHLTRNGDTPQKALANSNNATQRLVTNVALAAASSSSSFNAASQVYSPYNTTLYLLKKNWGAENANLQFVMYAGYAFDASGFNADFFSAGSLNFFGYNVPFAFGQANGYWSSTGDIGLHLQFSIGWIDIYKFAYTSYDVYYASFFFSPGVGVTVGDTCSIEAPAGGRVAQVTRTFIEYSFFYGIPKLCEIRVTVGAGGSFGVQYGAVVKLPTPPPGQTVSFASFANSTVLGYIVPSMGIAAYVDARLSLGIVWGGVRGRLNVVLFAIPATAGFNVHNTTMGSHLSMQTTLLSGYIEAYYEVWSCCFCGWFCFRCGGSCNWGGSWVVFTWPGFTFTYDLYNFPLCYPPGETLQEIADSVSQH